MPKLIATIFLLAAIPLSCLLFLHFLFSAHINESIQTNKSGYFDAISMQSFEKYDSYTLYTHVEENKIKETNFIVYKTAWALKGLVVLDINKNQEKNSYSASFYINNSGVYDREHENKITINMTKDMEINILGLSEDKK